MPSLLEVDVNKIIRYYALLLLEHTIVSILLSMVVVFTCRFVPHVLLYILFPAKLNVCTSTLGYSYEELTVLYLLYDMYLLIANVNQVSALGLFSM